MRYVNILASILVLASACGGAPPPPPAAAPSAPAAATPSSPLSQVSLAPTNAQVPPTLMVVARLNDIDKSADSIDRVFKLQTSLRSLIGAEVKDSAVVLSGSLDIAVALGPGTPEEDPTFVWAFSVPLKSIDDAVHWRQAQGDDVVATPSGTYRVKGKGGGLVCDIVPSLGDAAARGVCSDKTDTLAMLEPWMARGLPTEPKEPGDLTARISLAPLKNRYLHRLKTEGETAVRDARKELEGLLTVKDPDLLDAPEVIYRELMAFANDARAFDLGFGLDADRPELRFTTALEEQGTKSWLTHVLVSATEAPSTPPEMFYRLPKDATSAFWGHSADPALFTGLRAIVHKSAVAIFAMPFAHVPEADKQIALAWLDGIPTTSGNWVRASGILSHGKRPEKILTAQQAVDEAKVLFQTYLAWGISGEQGDAGPFIAWLKQTQDVLRVAITAAEKEDADMRKYAPTAIFVSNPAGYPKGSAALDIGFTFSSKDVWDILPQNSKILSPSGDTPQPKGPPAVGKGAIRIVVVPEDNGHYWWGLSSDPAGLRAHMTQVLKGAPASAQLSSRTARARNKVPTGFGGFFNLGSLDAYKMLLDQKQIDAINLLPHKGHGSLYVLGSRTGTNAPMVSMSVVAGKDMLEDLSAAAASIPAQSPGASPPLLGPLP